MVSNASDDFPEPESPVTHTSAFRGMRTVTFFRLCSRPPWTTSSSAAAMGSPFYRVEQTFDSQLGRDVPFSSRQPKRRSEMADAGLFVGFGNPTRGREEQAIELFNETIGYYS